jgi:hypothetical protein
MWFHVVGFNIINYRTMDNVQNCDSYINIPSSQIYNINLLG